MREGLYTITFIPSIWASWYSQRAPLLSPQSCSRQMASRVHHLVPQSLQPVLRLSELREDLPGGKSRNLACDIHFHIIVF